MRNIWVYIVGAVVVLGGGIALYNGISGSTPEVLQTAAPSTTGQSTAKSAQAEVPKPDQTFSAVAINDNDVIVGAKDAPVTILEYASLTCPHCADFHQKVLPAIKKEYIDTGKARLVYRDFPLDQWALRASMIARCAGPERRYSFIETFFAQQKSWTTGDPAAGLAAISKLGGLDSAGIEACFKDEKKSEAVLQERLNGTELFAIRSTPTIIINGDRYSGGLSVEQMRAVIESKLK